MCDVLVAMPDATKDGKIVFGKNSDRPAGECQVLTYSPGENPNSSVRCSYVTVREASRVLATLGCRPYWCWGYETGMNEAGVVGGNTAIYTRALWRAAERESLGLTGMDLLRLGLEGGRRAEDVVGIIVELLERYGQWGSAVQGKYHEQGSYENAFIFADRKEAWVLETSGRHWVAERLKNGVRAISNELTIRNRWTKGSTDIEEFAHDMGWWNGGNQPFDFALVYSDHEHYARQVSHIRRMRAQQLLYQYRGIIDATTMMHILRDHYEDTFLEGPQFHPYLPDFHTLCMHASPAGFTWGNTATSMIVEIDPEDPIAPPCWVCYLPPCTGLYMAFHLAVPLPEPITRAGTGGLEVRSAPDAPVDGFSESSLWWRFNRIVDEMGRDPVRRLKEVRTIFDPIEKDYLQRVGELQRSPPDISRQEEFSTIVQDEVSEVMMALSMLEKRWDL